MPFVVTADGARLDAVVHAIERAALEAARGVGKLTKDPAVMLAEISGDGFKGSIAFTVADSRNGSRAADAVVRAVAPLTRQAGAERVEAEDAPAALQPEPEPTSASTTPQPEPVPAATPTSATAQPKPAPAPDQPASLEGEDA